MAGVVESFVRLSWFRICQAVKKRGRKVKELVFINQNNKGKGWGVMWEGPYFSRGDISLVRAVFISCCLPLPKPMCGQVPIRHLCQLVEEAVGYARSTDRLFSEYIGEQLKHSFFHQNHYYQTWRDRFCQLLHGTAWYVQTSKENCVHV